MHHPTSFVYIMQKTRRPDISYKVSYDIFIIFVIRICNLYITNLLIKNTIMLKDLPFKIFDLVLYLCICHQQRLYQDKKYS